MTNFFNYNNPYQNYQQPTNSFMINDIRFVSKNEAESFVPNPNTRVMLIARDENLCYLKMTDIYGNSTKQVFKYEQLNNLPTLPKTSEIDTKEFVKIDFVRDLENRFNSQIEELKKMIGGNSNV